MKKTLLIIVVLSCFHGVIYSQSDNSKEQEGVKSNALQISGGYSPFGGAYNISYERFMISFKENTLMGLWAKAGIGEWYFPWGNGGGPHQNLSLTLLTGQRSSHFELNIGLARFYDQNNYERDQSNAGLISNSKTRNDYRYFDPIGSLGYRYQKPSGNLIIRCGLGYPESCYVGLGFAF